MNDLIPPITDVFETSDGNRIFFGDWPAPSPLPFVAAHGLTNQHRNLAGPAALLSGEVRFIAPDLRGRGNSSKPGPGSYGVARHGQDVLELMDWVGVDRAVVGGHSMGAYVALAVAAAAPERVAGVVLVDGGVWIGEGDPSGADETLRLVDVVVQRLTMTFATPQEYLDHWRSYPAFSDGLNEVIEANLLHDLGRRADGYVPKCSPVAAKEDLEDVVQAERELDALLAGLRCPVLAIGAQYGILMAPDPVLGEEHFAKLRSVVSNVETITVPGTDHHTVVLSPEGAQACAEAIQKFTAQLG